MFIFTGDGLSITVSVCHLIEYMCTLCCVQCAYKFVFNDSTINRIRLNKYQKVKTAKFYSVQICFMYYKVQCAFKIPEPSK